MATTANSVNSKAGAIPIAVLETGNIPLNAPLVDITLLDQIVVPPINAPCSLDRENSPEDNATRRGSSLAADIREITKTIESETDCLALQQKIKTALSGLEEDLKSSLDEVEKKLDEILPLLRLPTNPLKVLKYLKKSTLGRVLPDLDATIDLIKRILEVAQATLDLIQVIQDVKPRLEACAIGTINNIIGTIENEIDQTVLELQRTIERAIGEAICDGLVSAGVTGDNIADILNGVNTVNGLIEQFETINSTLDTQLGSSLGRIGQNQTLIQDITGIPPVLNTSSIEAFVQSVNSDEYAQYRADVNEVLNQPEPVNIELPVITGNVAVGSTLTCSNGVWTSNGVVTTFPLTFQWFRNGNQEIAGANTFQYTPTVDDVEYSLRCRVAAETAVTIEDVFTAQTAPVVFDMAPGDKPVILGTPKNGSTLQCTVGTWPFTPTTVMYEWSRVTSFGAVIRVQTLSANNLYTVKSVDIGSTIICKVVASAFRYTLSVTTDNTAVVVS